MELQIQKIEILDEIKNPEDASVDVKVTLNNRAECLLLITTEKNILRSMNEDKIDYYSPRLPAIIVRKITEEILQETFESYLKQHRGYFFRLYSLYPKSDLVADLHKKNQIPEENWSKWSNTRLDIDD